MHLEMDLGKGERSGVLRPVGDGVRNRARGRGDALKIHAHEGGPPVSTEYLLDGFLLDRLIGFILDHLMQIQRCKKMQWIKISGLMRINK
jgi:hypothetical protein